MAVVGLIDEDVCGEGWESGGDFPDVEVVDFEDAVDSVEVSVDGGDVGASGCGFEEDPPGVTDQSPAGFGHQHGHDECGDGVGAGPAGDQDDQTGDGGGDEGE